jgi:CRISPR/Cas system-associated exonuclease Cas4 (RecB family)
MQPFLEKLAQYITEKYENELNQVHIIFPSQRAGIYFRKYLSKYISKPVFAPKIYSLLDFVSEYSAIALKDDIDLLFELFEIYRKYLPDAKIEKFYRWGKIIINDFDEIDKNTDKASAIFRIISELKQTEEDFNLDLSDYEKFIEFWKSFSDEELTETQQEFFKIWKILGSVYLDFKKILIEKKIGYEALAYNSLYEKIINNELECKFKKIIFAGFNKLTKVEKDIIKLLISKNQAEIFFDADRYYTDNEINEAGKFIRENIVNFNINEPKWIGDKLNTTSKNIQIINTVSVISMVKALGNKLSELNDDELENTVVVVPELQTLLPLLNSLPENIKKVNITIGNIFKNSRLYSLLENLQLLKKNYDKSINKFYFKDVIAVLKHPFFAEKYFKKINNFIEYINANNIIYISEEIISNNLNDSKPLIEAIFKTESDIIDIQNNFAIILDYLNTQPLISFNKTERKFAEYFKDTLLKLIDLCEIHNIKLDTEEFWDILLELISFKRVPFSGEAFEGLQIMGLLETRLLSFKNVYILSVNEGILPPNENISTFIPYSLRKAFKLSVIEDTDAIYSNIFYNLIKESENTVLFYYNDYESISNKEKSRYILQLEKELKLHNPNIIIENLISQSFTGLPKNKEIVIEKNESVIANLMKFKNISPSALVIYLTCKLQFYFKYIANLKQPPSAEEYFTGEYFGSLLHDIMYLLYSDYLNKYINEIEINNIIKKAENEFDNIWKTVCLNSTEFKEFAFIKEGKNYLLKGIINKLVLKILQNDLQDVPFKILKTEDKITYNIKINSNNGSINLSLRGKLDRVDYKEDVIRIIDYKTGTIEKLKPYNTSSDEEYISILTADNKYKENFQQYFYALLYFKNYKADKIKTGIYELKQMAEGIKWFDEDIISLEKLNLFEDKIIDILTEIFSSETLFIQTENPKNCKYCPYKSICYKD